MKTSQKHRRPNPSPNRTIGLATVLLLAAMIFGGGLAQGGGFGQTGTDKKNDIGGDTATTGQSQGTGPTVLTSGGGNGGGSTGVTTGTTAGTGSTVPTGSTNAGGSTPINGNPQGTTPGVVVVQTGNQNGQQQPAQTSSTPPQVQLAPVSEVEKILSKHKFADANGVPFYGYDAFESARSAIVARIATINDPAYQNSLNPNKNPAGPWAIDVMQIPHPDRYQLGPGDTLTLRVESPTTDPTSQDLVIDQEGAIIVPQTGKKIVARGQTLSSFEHNLTLAVREGLKEARVQLLLKELRSMSVYIEGESFAPGMYTLPATTTLYNALWASGGPNENGSFRRITVRRVNGERTEYDLYKLMVDGNPKMDVPLQPGDVIHIPTEINRVLVKGEVIKPAIFEMKPGEKLSDAIHFSGGLKATGVAQSISLEQNDRGIQRILKDVQFPPANPDDNPILNDNDSIEVYSIRTKIANEVTIEGPVDQPHHYSWFPGMTVADLIDDSRGLLPEAYPDRADLFRKKDDDSHLLMKIDLQKAMKRDKLANLPLEVDDRLVIYAYSDVQWMGDRTVQVLGAVNKQGTLYRADKMTVADAVIQAGGLAPNAYATVAFLQRTNPDGTVGPLLKLNLLKAQLAGGVDNAILQDRDILTVFTVQQATYVPQQTVQVSGAVQNPMAYPESPDMTVRDLILLAGNLLPDAYTKRAFLQRQNLDGTFGELKVIDLDKALAGDPANNLLLEPADQLSVYLKEQIAARPEQIVTIGGAVQKPGSYPRAENMTLADVISLAGGPTDKASTRVEIAKARVLEDTPILRVPLRDAMGQAGENIKIDDGDVVSVMEDARILEKPYVVTISGEVLNPGPYAVTSPHVRLSEIIKRAGGLRAEAFPSGAQFTRNVQYVTTAAQQGLGPRILAVLTQVQTDEYQRALARGDVDKMRAIADALKEGLPAVSLSTTGTAAPTQIPNVPGSQGALNGKQAVTPARQLQPADLTTSGNININVANAIKHPGGPDDVLVRDGDQIVIPDTPISVAVIGAVMVPTPVKFVAGRTVRYYLTHAGGAAADAALDQIIVIRSSGDVLKASLNLRIEDGDTIFVPTKVQADHLRDKGQDFTNELAQVTNAGLLLAVINALIK